MVAIQHADTLQRRAAISDGVAVFWTVHTRTSKCRKVLTLRATCTEYKYVVVKIVVTEFGKLIEIYHNLR